MRGHAGNGVRGQDLPARKLAIIFGCTWDGLSEKRTAEGRRLVRVVDTEARSAKRGSRCEWGIATVPPASGDIAKLRSAEAIYLRLLRRQLYAASQAYPTAIHR